MPPSPVRRPAPSPVLVTPRVPETDSCSDLPRLMSAPRVTALVTEPPARSPWARDCTPRRALSSFNRVVAIIKVSGLAT